jgi:hypothetical protein
MAEVRSARSERKAFFTFGFSVEVRGRSCGKSLGKGAPPPYRISVKDRRGCRVFGSGPVSWRANWTSMGVGFYDSHRGIYEPLRNQPGFGRILNLNSQS